MRLQTIWALNWDRDKTKGFENFFQSGWKQENSSQNRRLLATFILPYSVLWPPLTGFPSLFVGIKFVQEVRFHDSITIRK